ncbi:MAG: butyrate kinase [Bacteroidales bacterium]|nr:butyrate kinase [Bacteroidales bacterium]
MKKIILCLKTVSKTTKISAHSMREQIFLINIRHSDKELEECGSVLGQLDLRKEAVLQELKKAHIELKNIGIIVCRGGVLKPIPGGIYAVNDAMLADLHHPMAVHESNLGGLIAYNMVKMLGDDVRAITVDPACTDEMSEIAKISGMPEITRISIMHTLSQRTVAKHFAATLGKTYEEARLIVAHLGSGTSVGVHCDGKIIDVNNGLHGDGPMSPARTGGLPVGQLVELCFSGKYSKEEILEKIHLNGGLKAYLGTNDAKEVEKRVLNGDKNAELIYKAIAYQTAKEIGALSTVLDGQVDGILITGGLAYSDYIINEISKKVKFIAPVRVYPGESEMEGLALNGYRVLVGEADVIEYS